MAHLKNVIVLLEDEETIRTGFKHQLEDLEIDYELVECKDYSTYQNFLSDKKNIERIKCFIIDLSNTPEERLSASFQSATYINEQYLNNRVPIFVHSAYLEKYSELNEKGTVYKISKSTESTSKICSIIKSMHDSGFLEIFCLKGSLETKIMSEIHSAFIEQFKPNEIEKIISAVKVANPDNPKERTVEIFERIALRSVYQNFINRPESSPTVQVNPVEHYYRRNLTKIPFYTGDVFKDIDSKRMIFIATPRCNILNHNFEQLLACKINPIKDDQKANFLNKQQIKESGETKGHKSLKANITDDVTNSFIGERFRFLPAVPLFEGGFVDFKDIFSIFPGELLKFYEYEISIADDLTNDVIRKLASYLLRGGISDTHYSEAQSYIS